MPQPQTRLRPVTEQDILEIEPHVGDTISKDLRIQLHHEAVAQHQAHRNSDGDPGYRNWLVSGPKGSGKTTLAAALALKFYLRGYNVCSNLSLLYGHVIEGDATSIYAFAAKLPPRTVIVLDEVQQLLSRYSMASIKSQTFIGGLAELRKKRISIISCSSQEGELNSTFKYELDRVYYPRPRRYVRLPQQGKAHYDKWCHIRVVVAGERPFAWHAGKTMGETLGLSPASKKPKLKVVRGYSPAEVYAAAALQSSFQSLKWGKEAGQAIVAKDMHAALGSDAVIAFDDDEELDTDSATTTDWQAILEADRPEVSRLWAGVQATGLHLEREVPTPLLLTKLAMTGNPFDPEPLEALLSRWTGHRPGSRTVDITALGQWFQAQ